MRFRLLAVLWTVGLLEAQPRIRAVVNGASNLADVAPGSFATIYGDALAAGTATAAGVPLPAALGGVSVTVNGRPAPLYFVRGDQVNFQVPAATAPGNATAVVQSAGQSSAPFNFNVVAAAPGILVFGDNRAVVQNQDGTLNNTGAGALPGSTIIAYLTGQGALDNPVADGAPAGAAPLSRAALPSSATIGGANAAISFLGLAPGFVGLLQANLVVPAGLAPGDHPLVVTIGGRASNNPRITVRAASAGLLTRLGSVDTGGGNLITQVRGDYAYVADPTRMRFLNLFGGTTGTCRVRDGQLVTANGGPSPVLNVFSLANPEQPVRVGGPFNLPQFSSEFQFIGNFAVFHTVWFQFTQNPLRIFQQQGDFFSVNLTDPARPALASPLASNPSPYFNQLAVTPDTMLLLSTTNNGADTSSGLGRLVIADTSDPANLRILRQVAIPRTNTLNGAAVEGATALVVGNTRSWESPGDFAIRGNVTLTTVDLSDPRNPRPIATVVTSARNTFTIGRVVSLGGGWYAYPAFQTPENRADTAIVVVDARDPANPA
ncbi:MAG: hypothetical protein K2Q23_19605, partial [Bryobacteraceae bacterium]|nr:hypothetical protein [Bryobacteraceae bacterium]